MKNGTKSYTRTKVRIFLLISRRICGFSLYLSHIYLIDSELCKVTVIDGNTIKLHKKKLVEKLHAENITEAVGIAANMRLI